MPAIEFTWDDEENLREVTVLQEYDPIPYTPAWGPPGEPPLNPPEGGYCEPEDCTVLEVTQYNEEDDRWIEINFKTLEMKVCAPATGGVNQKPIVESTRKLNEEVAKLLARDIEAAYEAAQEANDWERVMEACAEHEEGLYESAMEARAETEWERRHSEF